MRPYVMCLLTERSKFPVQRTEFVALDDNAAVLHALAFCKRHFVEVLSGEMIIARIPRGTRDCKSVERAKPGSSERRW
jgi:hypothetical protein